MKRLCSLFKSSTGRLPRKGSVSTEGRHRAVKDMVDAINSSVQDKMSFYSLITQYMTRIFPCATSCGIAEIKAVQVDDQHDFQVSHWLSTGYSLPYGNRFGHQECAFHVLMSGRSCFERDLLRARYIDLQLAYRSGNACSAIMTPVSVYQKRLGCIVLLSKVREGFTSEDVYWSEFCAGLLGCFMDEIINRQSWQAATALLSRMIPSGAIATLQQHENELSSNYPVFAESHECVSMLFVDIVGFTSLSRTISPLETMTLLHTLFCDFDDICLSLHLYKVETVGDGYVVAAGLVQTRKPSESAMLCVIAGCLFIDKARHTTDPYGNPLQVRIGINSGPVTSGVVSKLRPRYNVYGDTVNIASRMENTAIPGKIQITTMTKQLLSDRVQQFPWEVRNIDVKGQGQMVTYQLDPSKFQVIACGEVLKLLQTESRRVLERTSRPSYQYDKQYPLSTSCALTNTEPLF